MAIKKMHHALGFKTHSLFKCPWGLFCALCTTSVDSVNAVEIKIRDASEHIPVSTVRSVEQRLRAFGPLDVLRPGFLKFFGSGAMRKSKLRELDPVSCSLMVHAIGMLSKEGKLKGREEIKGLASDLVNEVSSPERVESFDHLSIAQILHGFSFLPEAAEPFQVAMIADTLAREKMFRKLDGRTIAGILSSLARLKFKDRDIIYKLATRAVSIRAWMQDQELSNVFWAFGLLNVRDVALLDSMAQEIIHPQILPALTAQAIANILLSCARLDYTTNAPFLNKIYTEAFQPYRLKAYNKQHLSNLTWALGRLRFGEWKRWRALVQECIAAEQLPKYSPAQICNIFSGWAASRDVVDADACHALLSSVLHPSTGSIRFFDPQSFAKLIWATGKLNVTMQDDFEALMKEGLNPKCIARYNNQDLSNIFIGCAKQRFSDQTRIAPLLREVMTPNRLMKYDDQQLANITWSLGEMGIREERVFRLLARGILDSTTICNKPSQVLMILRGWTHGHFKYHPGLMKIVNAVLKPNTLTKFLPHDLRGILWCLRELRFGEAHLIQLLEDRLPENNRGVVARFRQRSMAADNRNVPDLFTVRKQSPD